MGPRLVGLVLEVRDVDRSIGFYRDVVQLQLNAQQEWEGHKLAYLEGQAVELTLLQVPGEGTAQRGAGLVVHLAVDDVEEQLRRTEEALASLVRALEEAPWGGRSFIVADPDGYNLMFTGP